MLYSYCSHLYVVTIGSNPKQRLSHDGEMAQLDEVNFC